MEDKPYIDYVTFVIWVLVLFVVAVNGHRMNFCMAHSIMK